MGGEEDGFQMFALGDKRCANYMNCGPGADDGGGVGKTNIIAISLFQKGAGLVFSGDFMGLQKCIKEINEQMLVMFVQGTLRYATNWGNVGVILPRNSVKALLLQLLYSHSSRRSTQKQPRQLRRSFRLVKTVFQIRGNSTSTRYIWH